MFAVPILKADKNSRSFKRKSLTQSPPAKSSNIGATQISESAQPLPPDQAWKLRSTYWIQGQNLFDGESLGSRQGRGRGQERGRGTGSGTGDFRLCGA